MLNTLGISQMSDIVFYSVPEAYAEEVFVPELKVAGALCHETPCEFGHTRKLYNKCLGWTFLGALLPLILGVSVANAESKTRD